MSVASSSAYSKTRLARRAFPILVVAYAVLAVLNIASVPVWEAVDEAGHFAYVKYLRDHRALPYQPNDAQHLVLSHWFHPPLYYAIGAVVTAGIDISDFEETARPNPHFVWVQGDAPGGWNVFLPVESPSFPPHGTVLAVFMLRVISAGIGATIVWLVYRLARLLLPTHPSVALGAAALTAFNPAFVYMMAGVQNDTLSAMLGTAILWWCARSVSTPATSWRAWVIGGILLGLALLTKSGALALAPVVAVAAGLSTLDLTGPAPLQAIRRSDGRSLKRMAGSISTTLGVAFLVAGWWYVRNEIVYGDPLAWQRYMTTHAFLRLTQPYDLPAFGGFAAQLARTYWAAFGYMNLVVDRPIYLILWSATVLAGLGLCRLLRVGRLWGDVRARWPAWLLVGAGLLAYVGSLVRYSMTLGGVGHGRLIFPAIGAASTFLAAGLFSLPPRALAGPLLGTFTLWLAALAVACPLLYIRPAYAIPQPRPAAAIPTSAGPRVTFGDGFRLLDSRVTPQRVQPGGRVLVSLYWQSGISNGPDVLVNLRLRDREGALLFQTERRPLLAHLPTDRWQRDAIYEDDYTVFVPANAYTGNSVVEVRVRPFSGNPLSPTGVGGQPLSTDVAVASLAIFQGRENTASGLTGHRASHPIEAQLGDQIHLLGFDLDDATAKPGGTIHLVLYWEARGPITQNYTVFTHVADQSRHPVAQHDAEPQNRAYPTSVWRVGEVVEDPYAIDIPPVTPPGQYQLLVGMYDHTTGTRLPVARPDGLGVQDSLQLATITIEH